MKLRRKKAFTKAYAKLPEKLKTKVDQTILVFMKNPRDQLLNNHRLKGDYQSLRSINVTGDLRIIFLEKNGYTEILLLDLGTHSQLYG